MEMLGKKKKKKMQECPKIQPKHAEATGAPDVRRCNPCAVLMPL